MMGHGNFFVEWKEQFVSQERGNRVVHYFLKDSAGESILAVVGTERSVRHMFYVVADDFIQAYGKESSVHAGFKWRSRREVVDWLTSMLSKQYSSGDHSEPCKCDAIQTLGTLQFSHSGVVVPHSDVPDDKVRSRNSKGLASDIVWSGAAWTCGKRLKHYPSFCRNGTSIMVQSFVYVMAKGENHYLAYLEDMYEDKRGQKKVKVRWFHHSQEVKGVITLRNSHPREVFITPYAQAISVECVDGPAIVLNREHYEKCVNAFPHDVLSKVHLCYRQFKSNRLKPFDLSKLRGYYDQPAISCLSLNVLSKSEPIFYSMTGEDDEDLDPENSVGPKFKRMRNANRCRTFQLGNAKVRKSGGCRHMLTHKSCQKHKYSFLGDRFLFQKHVLDDNNNPAYEVNEKIELLCQDSGIRGCWFRCTVLYASPKQIRVQYDDLQDEDGCGNLEEWVSACKVALPDKIGMRHPGRLITRPVPQEQIELTLEIGVAVDAWWSDGWWEGVVTGLDDSGNDDVHVYFPGESLFLNIHRTNLRISRDWYKGRWIDVEAKPSILSMISEIDRTDYQHSKSATHVKSSSLAISCIDVNAGTDFSRLKEETLEEIALASLEKLREANDELKQVSSEDDQSEEDMVDTKNSSHNLKDSNGGDDNTCSDTEDENDDNSNGVKSEMDSMETSEQNCREEEAEDMDMEGVDV